MSWLDALIATMAALLTLAATPLSRVRRFGLALFVLIARLALPAAVAACGLFAIRPDLVPPELAATAGQLVAAHLSLSPAHPTVLWLGLAGVLLFAGLPILAHLEYARRSAALLAMLDGLHRQAVVAARAIRQACGHAGSHAPVAMSYPDGDVAAGVAILRTVLEESDGRPLAAVRPPLVKDVLLAQSR
jgi:hypothetical protein